MFANVYGETTCGIDGVKINVEVDVANGLPAFDIVGLPTMSVREARERVKSALRNSDYPFPMTHITVNLAPADLKKEGSGLDLPIAIGILVSAKFIEQKMTEGKIFVGELSLDGALRKVNGVLSMIMEAKRSGFKEIYIPQENAAEGKLVTGIDVYTPQNLKELVKHLQGSVKLTPLPKENILQNLERAYDVDFADVKGQPVARRALEIAAAGGHSILLMGAPGCGKTMLARRLVTILPPVTEAEALEITKIYSIANLLPDGERVMVERPFRSPHHSVSASALLGGGSYPRPGEVTLSHNGVLFLDELPEFERYTLEMLRQPLEDGEVNISRVRASVSYPSRFVLVAAQNPCPCGYLGDKVHRCSCKQKDIDNYRRKISGPLLDRIDMQINLVRVEYSELKDKAAGESSREIRKRVVAARNRQLERFAGNGIYCNGQMTRREVVQYCVMDEAAQNVLGKYFAALHLSARSHDRILKVARTIADLEGSEKITASHIAEAIQLRTSISS
ncbi:MAG: YifB family Mg chelatase-like AAA ATPase [Phascolarctobacterium sp.]|nr:YifB family Mg chelatase-like AAA ATPase [Phascolarctobacterium sp.]